MATCASPYSEPPTHLEEHINFKRLFRDSPLAMFLHRTITDKQGRVTKRVPIHQIRSSRFSSAAQTSLMLWA